ncbi:AraC family transcriptional regulator [Luteolibacter arcticus]|uniref:AraC family transcriptional regulator n=1 Tax=Luteolibacter arcticus TaxID=1581411 RepID=A0ABT3GC73_9BACT|nr:AraC family transcriptional regulator [Luteolibacter arcticus]MCW1921013.1 AraC family transcriptional regulator [Luteolibacter arcticus]
MLPQHAPALLYSGDGVALWGVHAERAQAVNWSELLKPEMVHLVLNLEGSLSVPGRRERLELGPGTAAILRTPAADAVHANGSEGDEVQRFVVMSATSDWLAATFCESLEGLHPLLRGMSGPEDAGQLCPINLTERMLCESLLSPPVPRALQPTWFNGKIVECFSLFGGIDAATGPDRDPLRERIDAAVMWLREHFRDELNLGALAEHVGSDPSYLSRLFKQHTGNTISQTLRQIRVDIAAGLLREGNRNVSQAAFEVGYSSLSHFTKAFVAEKGMRPSDWRAGSL